MLVVTIFFHSHTHTYHGLQKHVVFSTTVSIGQPFSAVVATKITTRTHQATGSNKRRPHSILIDVCTSYDATYGDEKI